MTRRPAEVRFPGGVAVAGVDFDRAETLRDALQGVDRFFLAQATSPRQVENEIALIDAAVAVGVRHSSSFPRSAQRRASIHSRGT